MPYETKRIYYTGRKFGAFLILPPEQYMAVPAIETILETLPSNKNNSHLDLKGL